jgi:hypothetical protein
VSRVRKWFQLYRHVARKAITLTHKGIRKWNPLLANATDKHEICPLEGTMLFSSEGGGMN